MDDLTAIKKCNAGQAEAFGYLVRKYQSEAIGHAVAILGNIEDARDAVQDAFLNAYKTLNRFDLSCRFYPWLYTILRNRCLKMLTSRRKEPITSAGTTGILSQQITNPPGVDVNIVEKALRELSPQDRELLTLKYLDGLRYDELAERLSVPLGTVMSRLYYARGRFREKVVRLQNRLDSEEIDNA
jgi:RNA polymerase sigma-70 factor (ECF subfamily)